MWKGKESCGRSKSVEQLIRQDVQSSVLSVCGLLNVPASSSDPLLFYDRMIVTSALKMMSKEAVRLCRNCLAGLRKTTRNLVVVVALQSVIYTCNSTGMTRKKWRMCLRGRIR
jgi:hypothetical protein